MGCIALIIERLIVMRKRLNKADDNSELTRGIMSSEEKRQYSENAYHSLTYAKPNAAVREEIYTYHTYE